MEPKYKLGQKVIIKPVKNQLSSARESDIGFSQRFGNYPDIS
ncbi:unnamed protein product, partial [marine sediment metagenome]